MIASLRLQPLLLVLRPSEPQQAIPTLELLVSLGLRHVEIAWRPGAVWIDQMASLIVRFPRLAIGAASVVGSQALAAVIRAGCPYAVSPVLEPACQHQAAASQLVLVPGVMTPSEVHQARLLGCRLVKLFPAASLGRDYWQRLRGPLGDPLPFCIAAGGLQPADLEPWLAAGVDAVALGSGLAGSDPSALRSALHQVLAVHRSPPSGSTPLSGSTGSH